MASHTEIRVNMRGAGFGSPFELAILGNTNDEVKKYSLILERLKNDKFLLDVQTNSKLGKPELLVKVDSEKAQKLGENMISYIS